MGGVGKKQRWEDRRGMGERGMAMNGRYIMRETGGERWGERQGERQHCLLDNNIVAHSE